MSVGACNLGCLNNEMEMMYTMIGEKVPSSPELKQIAEEALCTHTSPHHREECIQRIKQIVSTLKLDAAGKKEVYGLINFVWASAVNCCFISLPTGGLKIYEGDEL